MVLVGRVFLLMKREKSDYRRPNQKNDAVTEAALLLNPVHAKFNKIGVSP
jgi:hypothetical protein